MTSAAYLTDIPEDLAAEAAQVPGLSKRLASFLRAEVLQHRRRQSRYSLQTTQIAAQAEQQAALLIAAGTTPEQARAEFARQYAELMKDLAPEP